MTTMSSGPPIGATTTRNDSRAAKRARAKTVLIEASVIRDQDRVPPRTAERADQGSIPWITPYSKQIVLGRKIQEEIDREFPSKEPSRLLTAQETEHRINWCAPIKPEFKHMYPQRKTKAEKKAMRRERAKDTRWHRIEHENFLNEFTEKYLPAEEEE